ncbi:3-isopropylmalate dehydrogenase, putative [Talaromyces stipitatus ATCC 10500]|uniref:3-isopropylmalate dehydrogenase n=1 Tax=Talaromyces stipitatus (strain ATCC 10500 / CBS 375.48 / QM 6759 / NRRL 1006) TaxID=441959 RepID=B8M3W0_TALSN|nr:3-isopropylmalate dehydrogenase, putative [Talaromyces stipitatus ATCC 10500]EED20703.1 3-isopropylmalate dehydrogenase, putative [Talaromyces stipitatus ATCC 10500]
MAEIRKLLVLPGDHIGPEIIAEALKILAVLEEELPNFKVQISYGLIGGASLDKTGSAITDEVLETAVASDAVLLGSVGGPEWAHVPGALSPEKGILHLRQRLDAFANIRPCRFYASSLLNQSPLKPEIAAGVDFVLVRENCGGAYFGTKTEFEDEARTEVERCARVSAALARTFGRGKNTDDKSPAIVWNADKANVLASGRFWRTVTHDIFEREFPDIELHDQLADSMAMVMVKAPTKFNGVIHTDNTFGDILSDISGGIVGSLGVLPSASVCGVPGSEKPVKGIYEAVHGSAPDISGTGQANPIAQILSLAMLLRYSFSMPRQADLLEDAVRKTLEVREHGGLGIRTKDLGGSASTQDVGDAVAFQFRTLLRSADIK